MMQSEELMIGVQWGEFSVDMKGYTQFKNELLEKLEGCRIVLEGMGLARPNSNQDLKTWLESMGIDCSRGASKDVYLAPVNVAAHPTELKALAKFKELEAIRRKFKSFEENLYEEV